MSLVILYIIALVHLMTISATVSAAEGKGIGIDDIPSSPIVEEAEPPPPVAVSSFALPPFDPCALVRCAACYHCGKKGQCIPDIKCPNCFRVDRCGDPTNIKCVCAPDCRIRRKDRLPCPCPLRHYCDQTTGICEPTKLPPITTAEVKPDTKLESPP